MMEGKIRVPESIPGQPTDAPPGSPRKVRVLMERAARREALFHPGDNLKRIFPLPDAEEPDDLREIDLAG